MEPRRSSSPMKTETADYLQSNSLRFAHSVDLKAKNFNHLCRTNSYHVIFEYVYIFMFIFIYLCFADAVKSLHSFSNLLSKFRQFLPSDFQDQAFSSKIPPRSDIFFQVTFRIHASLARSDIFFQDLPRYL